MIAPSLRAIVVLGGFAWQALWRPLAEAGYEIPKPRPAFAHGGEADLPGPDGATRLLLGCYHPSQQNTFTGRVTADMVDAIFRRAGEFTSGPLPARTVGHQQPRLTSSALAVASH